MNKFLKLTNSELNDNTKMKIKGLEKVYNGKVRDVYFLENNFVAMVASNRISAFDVILKKEIPFKGQVLNQLANYFLDATKDIVPNWKLSCPYPNLTIGHTCQTYRVEMVIRGYLTGHAWRTYRSGERMLCGVRMPDGMKENDAFPEPIITPATKAEEGHDEDISREEIIKQGIIPEDEYIQLEAYTRDLFGRGTEMAAKRGLILVDTKYEFGQLDGEIKLIDEIHTPDSSRYFYADMYQENQDKGIQQKQLSKEFVRQWLIENDFQGLEGQVQPEMDDSFVKTVSDRYIELYEKMTGVQFVKEEVNDEDLTNAINRWVERDYVN